MPSFILNVHGPEIHCPISGGGKDIVNSVSIQFTENITFRALGPRSKLCLAGTIAFGFVLFVLEYTLLYST
jgi:hypothetical protein